MSYDCLSWSPECFPKYHLHTEPTETCRNNKTTNKETKVSMFILNLLEQYWQQKEIIKWGLLSRNTQQVSFKAWNHNFMNRTSVRNTEKTLPWQQETGAKMQSVGLGVRCGVRGQTGNSFTKSVGPQGGQEVLYRWAHLSPRAHLQLNVCFGDNRSSQTITAIMVPKVWPVFKLINCWATYCWLAVRGLPQILVIKLILFSSLDNNQSLMFTA